MSGTLIHHSKMFLEHVYEPYAPPGPIPRRATPLYIIIYKNTKNYSQGRILKLLYSYTKSYNYMEKLFQCSLPGRIYGNLGQKFTYIKISSQSRGFPLQNLSM